ncbi:competence protein ComEA helix-hairpin-helix repeat region [Fodinibius roseus]|uniref:Competence protein ComEA helix-hairpin-helix repeat region n=1 Tax=Fodinibius roseus TaxID=1194090 RepID=A0A1M5CW42_9BACT|nr:helix-hairpin-helix domain-containing protein [Fodinibius roseus]SHF58807.1 competence protein ComEA helix-hairpin-helix repeat region [Fodinibius roseus]
MRIRDVGISVFVLLLPVIAGAQQRDSTRSEVREDLEQALEDFDSDNLDMNSEQLVQLLQDMSARPVNVNQADLHMLMQVPGINLKTARAIIRYRRDVKPFEALQELTKVTGIGRVTYEKIHPYVTIGRGLELSSRLFTDRRYWTNGSRFQAFTRYQRDLQESRGYRESPEEGGYLGGPAKYYQRMDYQSDHLSANLTQEKDAGEMLPGPMQFDHQSWHLALENNGRLQTLVAGDYSLSFGQGLVLWNGGVFGKGSNVTGAPNRSGRGIKPYTSAQETNYYRGAAVTYGGRFQLTGFYSSRRRTASEISVDTVRFPTESGYHRTMRQQARRGNLRQCLYGGHIRVELPVGFIGATGYQTTFDRYVAASDQDYARYDFEGISASTIGMDYSLLLGPAVAFGEAARSKNGGWGVLGGVESSIGPDTEVALAYRNYQKEFQSILGDGFGEGSGTPKNEEGIYLGLQHTHGDNIILTAYMDQFRFPSARFGTHQPTRGYDWLGKAEMEIMPGVDAYLQVRGETKEDEYEVTDELGRFRRELGTSRRSSIRGHIEYWVNDDVRLRSRAEWVRSREAGETAETGLLLYQDLRLVLGEKLTLDTRITVFDTGSYASRVYQFENDLLYVFASQPLFDRGQRMYLLVNYEPFSFLEIWAKVGLTKYEDRQVIGSGLNEIQGDTRSEVGVQARIKF